MGLKEAWGLAAGVLDDSLAQSAVVLRTLLVVDACSQVDDYAGVGDEGKAVDDGFGGAAYALNRGPGARGRRCRRRQLCRSRVLGVGLQE